MSELQLKLSVLPVEPGCYLMKNSDGEIIYVGKAKNLRSRVRSYFTGAHDEKTMRLVQDIVDFDFIVTQSEIESLLLENTLIKKHYPRYNILLKDDKSYPFIKITKEKHPKLVVTRTVKPKSGKYRIRMPTAPMKRRNFWTEFIRLENVMSCRISCVSTITLDNVSARVFSMFQTNKTRK